MTGYKDSLNHRPTGWPTTQNKIYRADEIVPLGKLISEYNSKTKEWEPVAVCRNTIL